MFVKTSAMKIRLIAFSALLGLALFHPSLAFSHHSNAAFDPNKLITVTGVVKEFQWVNPHTYIYLTVDDGQGGKLEWRGEGRPPGQLSRGRLDTNLAQARRDGDPQHGPGKGRHQVWSGYARHQG